MEFSQYVNKLGKALYELRKEHQLCDIIIHIGKTTFHAHKAVLAAGSSYFMAMFTSGFKEKSDSEVTIDGNAEIFEILLEFAYTGKLKITSNTAYDVLEMACYMQFTDLSEACQTFLSKTYLEYSSLKIEMGEVFRMSQLANTHANYKHMKQLVTDSEKYMSKNVKQLKDTGVFLQSANEDYMNLFLQRQDLSDKNEESEVLDLVIAWLKHDWANRSPHAMDLLSKVRLGFVSEEYLKTLLDTDELFVEILDCKHLLEEVIRQKSAYSMTELAKKIPRFFATRSTISAPIILNLWGYFSYYNSHDRSWHDLSQLGFYNRNPPENVALIVVQGKLYSAGGRVELEKEYDSDHVYDEHDPAEYEQYYQCQQQFAYYNAGSNKWIQLPQMLQGRHDFILVHMSGFIYAIGGYDDDDDAVDDLERYDIKKKEWRRLAPLARGYEWNSVVTFKGKLLAYGKSTVARKQSADTSTHEHVIFVYDPATNIWQMSLREEHTKYQGYITSPVLRIHQDHCYRVRYEKSCDGFEHTSCCSNTPQKPLVNLLEFTSIADAVTITIGEVVKQDLIPQNNSGAFRIHDAVFVNVNGFVTKINMKISTDRTTDVILCQWKGLRTSDFTQSGIVCYTFDKKKLHNRY